MNSAPPQRWGIEIACRNAHTQTVTVTMPEAEARQFAALLTGHSPLFVYPIPDDQTYAAGRIGFCGICGGRLRPPNLVPVAEG